MMYNITNSRVWNLSFAMRCVACLLFAETAHGVELDWSEIRAGMSFERQRLQSGAYSATGQEILLGFSVPAPVELFSTFDFARDSILFEHRGKEQVNRGGTLKEMETMRVICALPDRTYHFTNIHTSAMLNILPANTMRYPGQAGTRGYLDPRSIGFLRVHQAYSGIPFEKAFKAWVDRFEKGDLTLQREGDGVVCITSQQKASLQTAWVDTERGFTLVRFRVELGVTDKVSGSFVPLSQYVSSDPARLKKQGITEEDLASIVDVTESVDLTWTQLNGVWVPISYQHVAYAPGGTSENPFNYNRYEQGFSMQWASVNLPVPSSTFDKNALGIPDGTSIFDRRDGKSEFAGKTTTLRQLTPSSTNSGVIGVVGLLLIAGVGVGFWRRSWRK